MKYDCEVIQDLIPLEQDGVASDKSVEIVNEHIKECGICNQYYDCLIQKINISTVQDSDERYAQESKQVATYGNRIRKRRLKTIIAVVAGIIGLLVVQRILVFGLIIGGLDYFGEEYKTSDAAEYGIYNGHIEAETKGMFSDLLIFPTTLPDSAHIEDYYYYCSNKGLDNSYQIFLECELSTEDFQAEKQRLSNLDSSYKSETKEVIYSETGFNYPTYMTVFDHDSTYEYALIDNINNRIIYIFAQFGLEKIPMKKSFLPTTFSVADERGYSMYYFQTNKDTWYRPDLDEVDN